MILWWIKIAALAAVVAALIGAGWKLRDWQAARADLARERAAEVQAIKARDKAAGAAQTFEGHRDAIRSDLRAPAPRVAPALALPVAAGCPAVGDVVLPAGALDRLIRAAGQLDPQ